VILASTLPLFIFAAFGVPLRLYLAQRSASPTTEALCAPLYRHD
jgi:hypothetical protein